MGSGYANIIINGNTFSMCTQISIKTNRAKKGLSITSVSISSCSPVPFFFIKWHAQLAFSLDEYCAWEARHRERASGQSRNIAMASDHDNNIMKLQADIIIAFSTPFRIFALDTVVFTTCVFGLRACSSNEALMTQKYFPSDKVFFTPDLLRSCHWTSSPGSLVNAHSRHRRTNEYEHARGGDGKVDIHDTKYSHDTYSY